ncbi:MAG: hypothetical protein ACXV5L_04095 [Thermoanaerobaculia bacterium]
MRPVSTLPRPPMRVLASSGVRLHAFLAACALLVIAGCHRDAARSRSFTDSLRCGMTRDDVTRIARQHGYNDSDASWLARATKNESQKSKELLLVDLTFRNGHLVAFRQGSYDPRSRRVAYRTIDLCSADRSRAEQ